MAVCHHPPEDLLVRFATARLDEAEHLVVGVHISRCTHCQRFVHAFEQLAGDALNSQDPVPLPEASYATVLNKIGEFAEAQSPSFINSQISGNEPNLPEALRGYTIGKARRVAPGLKIRPIHLHETGKWRAFLLEARPGIRMLDHSHRGKELTVVLKGSFSHELGRFTPGDFDYGDESNDHSLVVDDDETCICLVAMDGDLRLNGFLGRIVSPFIRF